MDPWGRMALELLGSLGARVPMDPSSMQAVQFALRAIAAVRRQPDIGFDIADAKGKLLTLRLVLRRLLDGVPPDQIRANVNMPMEAISANVLLKGALNRLAYVAGLHAGATIVIFLYVAVRRPDLRVRSPYWEVWRMANDDTAAHIAEAIQRLRHALELFKAGVRAVERAAAHPCMTADWITSMLAAEQLACYASVQVDAAQGEAAVMGLAISGQHGYARNLVEELDV